ncbi:MAG: asparagine synthase (glutamine-hydrolyzing) [Gammaproteobacteria bacterium]
MCGIAGIVPRLATDPESLNKIVRRMTASLVHRGPDDEGFFIEPSIALGMRRLSIIDIAGSRQPINSADGNLAIVFNGEIYNYRGLRDELTKAGRSFQTSGDTEVVLQAYSVWGEDGIRKLEGMFALAIWDKKAQTLTLARDWFGQKSIYFAESQLGWLFASEPKAILASAQIERGIDLQTLSHYMTLRYLPGDGTLFAGVKKVLPAHMVKVTAIDRHFQKLWTPRYGPKHEDGEAEVLDSLDSILKDVVASHLMSEVPLGAFLSGGMDSSTVVAYAALALETPLNTFSMGVNVESQSELHWAREVAMRYHTHHVERVITPDLASLVPKMVAALDEPVDPFAAGVYVVSEITAQHVTVALGGDGGDELFAGYDRYLGQQLAETYARLSARLRRQVLRPLLKLVPEGYGYKVWRLSSGG